MKIRHLDMPLEVLETDDVGIVKLNQYERVLGKVLHDTDEISRTVRTISTQHKRHEINLMGLSGDGWWTGTATTSGVAEGCGMH